LEINSYFTSPSSLFILVNEKQSHFAWCGKFDATKAIKSEKIEANSKMHAKRISFASFRLEAKKNAGSYS
jgi:hypothetical protein